MHRRPLFLAALATTLFTGTVLADVTVSVAEPRDVIPTTAPAGVRFDLLLLNEDTSAADTHEAPATLPVRVTTANGTYDAIAQRFDGRGDAETISLKPAGFARVKYIVDRKAEGAVTVALREGSTAAAVVQARTPNTAPPPATTSPDAPPRGPLEAVVQQDPNYKSELGLVEYLDNRIKPHEPVYIIAGDEEVSTKFQFSFKYQMFNPEGPVAQKVPALGGIYFAYSQTSLWDLGEDSSPFYDTSYRPEVLLSYEKLDRFFVESNGDRSLPDWLTFSAQGGLRHESNGKDGDLSRSWNIVYVRPIVTVAADNGWFLTLAPTVFTYVYDLSDNPDIRDYRGHVELRAVMGQAGGIQLAATGRMSDSGTQRGSLELDLTVPIRKLSLGNFDVYFHTQYFMGYGETPITYDESTSALRFGISLVR